MIHANLQDKLVAGLTGAAPQRQVQEIYAKEAAPDLGPDAIKTRHILYAPNDDPSNASSVAADDPAWTIAEQKALAAYVRLQTNPELFDSIARTESDETQAQGPTGSGGKLPYFDSQSQVDAAFLAAILVPDLKDGQILEPVKSSFGWHVIQVMYHPTDEAHFQMLKQQADSGADFAILARDNSEAPTAGTGGRPRLGHPGSARRSAHRSDLRGADRQDVGRRGGLRRRYVPVQGHRGGSPDAGGSTARRVDVVHLYEVVRRKEGGRRHPAGRLGRT